MTALPGGGERPALTEYTSTHAELADVIRDLFPALVMKEEAGRRDTVPPASDNKAPDRVGDYRILREVGRGGMGIVHEAEHEALGLHVAHKVLPTQAMLDSRHLARFQREARAAARLHHTNIYSLGVTLYELLTLRPAFVESDRLTLIRRLEHDDPPRIPRRYMSGIWTSSDNTALGLDWEDSPDDPRTSPRWAKPTRPAAGARTSHTAVA